MKQITVEEGQTIIDVTLQELGSVEGLFAFLDANQDLDLDSDLEPGQKVLIREQDIVKPEVVNYYRRKGVIVNSGFD